MTDFTEIDVEKEQERAYNILCDDIDTYTDALPNEAKDVDTDLIADGVYNYSTDMKYLTKVYGAQQRDEGLGDGYNNGYYSGVKVGSGIGFASGLLFTLGATMLIGGTMNLLDELNVCGRFETLKSNLKAYKTLKYVEKSRKEIKDRESRAYYAIARSFGKNI